MPSTPPPARGAADLEQGETTSLPPTPPAAPPSSARHRPRGIAELRGRRARPGNCGPPGPSRSGWRAISAFGCATLSRSACSHRAGASSLYATGSPSPSTTTAQTSSHHATPSCARSRSPQTWFCELPASRTDRAPAPADARAPQREAATTMSTFAAKPLETWKWEGQPLRGVAATGAASDRRDSSW